MINACIFSSPERGSGLVALKNRVRRRLSYQKKRSLAGSAREGMAGLAGSARPLTFGA